MFSQTYMIHTHMHLASQYTHVQKKKIISLLQTFLEDLVCVFQKYIIILIKPNLIWEASTVNEVLEKWLEYGAGSN